MQWITREDVRIGRIACTWLINHHIDSEAAIGYLPAADIPARVDAAAIPFHVKGAEFDNTLYEQPEGPGLRALSEGYRAQHPGDDAGVLAATAPVAAGWTAGRGGNANRGRSCGTSARGSAPSARLGVAR